MKHYYQTGMHSLQFLLLISVRSVNAGSVWALLGQSLCRDDGFGSGLAITELDNGFVLAAGSPFHSKDRYSQGRVDFLAFNAGACLWETFASSIVGQRTQDQIGWQVSLSCNAAHVAISGDSSLLEQGRFGFVQVYQRAGSGWTQMGETIRDSSRFQAIPSNFGYRVHLSCDGTTLKVDSSQGSYIYIYKNNRWELSRAFESSWLLSVMARGVPAVAVLDEDSVSIHALDAATGQWGQQGNNITATPEDIARGFGFSVENLEISSDGKRIVLGSPIDGVLIYDLTSDGKTWKLVETAVNPDFPGSSSLWVSGDGSTIYVGSSQGYRAFRFASYPAMDPKNPNELRLIEYGNTIDAGTEGAIGVSKDGSVVTLSSVGKVEVYFFPDSNVTEWKRLDCYPNQATAQTQECQAPPTDTAAASTVQITGNLEVDDDSASAAAGVTFGVLALCIAVLSLGLFSLHNRKERKSADRSPEAESDTPKEEKNETEPLKNSTIKNPAEEPADEEDLALKSKSFDLEDEA